MNLPNVLTGIRILLIPAFCYYYLSGHPKTALVIFLLASFTDWLDGHLARKWNQITSFGKLADPVADKLMLLSALCVLAVDKRIPSWIFFVILGKEAVMVIASLFLLKKQVVVMANMFGKIATFAFVISIAMVFPWHNWDWMFSLGHVLIYVSAALSVFAMVMYGVQYIKSIYQE